MDCGGIAAAQGEEGFTAMRRTIHRAQLLIFALVIALLASCAGAGDDVPDVEPPDETPDAAGPDDDEEVPGELIKIRYGLPTAAYFITTVGVQYALQNGFFEDEGLDVEVTPLPGSTTAIRAMLSGDQDIVLTGGDTAFLAWQNGAPLKIISSPVARGTDVFIASSDVESISDMAGKRFGISEPGSTAEVLGRKLFEQYGVNPDTVQFVSLGTPADRVRALIVGQIDATAVTILVLEPVIQAIEEGSIHALTTFAEEFPDIPLAYNVASDALIRDNPDVVVRFLRAEIRGYRWAQENPEAAAEIAVQFIDETPLELLVNGMTQMAELGVYGLNGGVTVEGITQTQEALVELGNLRSVSEPTDVANFDLVAEAVAGLD